MCTPQLAGGRSRAGIGPDGRMCVAAECGTVRDVQYGTVRYIRLVGFAPVAYVIPPPPQNPDYFFSSSLPLVRERERDRRTRLLRGFPLPPISQRSWSDNKHNN